MASLHIFGYPTDNGRVLKDGSGNVVARGGINKCRKVRPHERGAWISNEVCSYYFKADGRWYSCRGRGDGVSASCRLMKKDPPERRRPSLSGAKRRRRLAGGRRHSANDAVVQRERERAQMPEVKRIREINNVLQYINEPARRARLEDERTRLLRKIGDRG